MTSLIQIMIGLGILLMIINVIFYVRFERLTKERGGFESGRVLYFPILLLVLFLAGYIAVWLFGDPDLIIAGILLGGSIFVLAMLGLMQRITQKVRQNEELKAALTAAEQASEAKSVFLSNMSHDIRTPLNAIIGYTELAKRDDLTLDEAKESLSKINHSGRQLLLLVNDVLEMRRIESGRSELNLMSLSLPRMMEDMHDLFAMQMEDMEINQEIMLQFLQVMGISAVVADNGEIAVKMVAEASAGQFDVILMDIQMPVMDGYEAARAIRSLPDPALSQIPIIAVSANVFEEDRRKAVEAGMDGSVGKPVDPRELGRVLTKVLISA